MPYRDRPEDAVTATNIYSTNCFYRRLLLYYTLVAPATVVYQGRMWHRGQVLFAFARLLPRYISHEEAATQPTTLTKINISRNVRGNVHILYHEFILLLPVRKIPSR